jgi:hypothetical protein
LGFADGDSERIKDFFEAKRARRRRAFPLGVMQQIVDPDDPRPDDVRPTPCDISAVVSLDV